MSQWAAEERDNLDRLQDWCATLRAHVSAGRSVRRTRCSHGGRTRPGRTREAGLLVPVFCQKAPWERMAGEAGADLG